MYRLKNWGMLESLARYAGVSIDPNNPRSSRLQVALKLHENGNYFGACEAMTGDPAHTRDDFGVLIMGRTLSGQRPQQFYEGFPEADEKIQQ